MPEGKMDEWFEVFRAGNYPQGDVSLEDLTQLAAAYDPAWREAPLVVGHPQTDSPAWGWVRALRVRGDVLEAQFRDVHPALQAAVRARQFAKVSVKLLKTGEKGWYLGHVGLLGGALPAVAGLRPIEMSAAGTVYEYAIAKERLMDGEDRKELVRKVAEAEARAQRAEADLAAERRRRDYAEAKADVDRRIASGRLTPAMAAGLAEFVSSLDDNKKVVEFDMEGEHKKLSPREFARDLLDRMPSFIQFGESAGRSSDPGRVDEHRDDAGAGNDKTPVDAGRAALDRQVRAYMAAHPKVSYSAALDAVAAGGGR